MYRPDLVINDTAAVHWLTHHLSDENLPPKWKEKSCRYKSRTHTHLVIGVIGETSEMVLNEIAVVGSILAPHIALQ